MNPGMKPETAGRIGLARRAGKLAVGEEGCLKALRSRKAFLLILSRDASANTKKRFRDKCAFYQVPLIECGSRHELGAAVGRSAAVAMAVTDAGMARGILQSAGEYGGAH